MILFVALLAAPPGVPLMTTWLDLQTTLRARVDAAGLAPWATTDHRANLAHCLANLPISPLVACSVRPSDGSWWAVTREGDDYYKVVHMGDKRHTAGTAEWVVSMMEGE